MSKEVKVLLVEDEPDLRELLSSELEMNGYKVAVAEGGHEAYKVFSAQNFDLVISDLKMGLGGGIDLLKNIRDNNENNTPVILISGYSDFDSQKAQDLGAYMLLQKPFSLQSFVEAVEGTLAETSGKA